MNDIAVEAGIARQTLYKDFASKDAVLSAAIAFYSQKSLTKVVAEWAESPALEDKLGILFAHTVISSFEIVRSTPDAADMIGGYNEVGRGSSCASAKS